jgi:hypothetical protein
VPAGPSAIICRLNLSFEHALMNHTVDIASDLASVPAEITYAREKSR